MKIKLLAIIAILMPLLFSCGKSDSQSNDGDNTSTEVTETPVSTELDVDRIMSYKSKSNSDLNEKDYDFLLDQLEIIVNKANELPADQAKAFYTTLDSKQQDAVLIVAMILTDRSKLTDKQMERFQELEARDPSKK